jgi:hypothetical protein
MEVGDGDANEERKQTKRRKRGWMRIGESNKERARREGSRGKSVSREDKAQP